MRAFDRPGRSPVHATNAMVATSHPLASATALSILRDGGNAVDAAIGAAATLCVVEPHNTGLGGDCFVMLAEPDGSLHGLDGSGRAAAGAELGWYLEHGFTEIPEDSVHSVTVPGALKAWETLHQRFGAMDFARLFADAVGYARHGFPVASRVARDWQAKQAFLEADPGAVRHYLKDGRAPHVGEIMAAPALGDVLERVAKNGAQAFYAGAVAADIAATVQRLGGFLTEADLANVTADWVTPIRRDYRGLDICEMPPAGQGITALILLGLLAGAELPADPASAERLHLEMELGRIAYAVRDTHVADPAHMSASVEEILSDRFIARLAEQYDPSYRNDAVTLPDLPGSDTIYLSVVDRDRMAVSFINSLYGDFGSGIVTERTGITLQNRGACFVVDEGHPNTIGPARRPMHTIIPAMAMRDGRPAISFGVMGAGYQPMGHAHVLSNLLDYGMDVQEALDDARIFWDRSGALVAESGISREAVAGLRRRGFEVTPGGPHGGGQMILIDHDRGVLTAGSDPRKDGHAAGY